MRLTPIPALESFKCRSVGAGWYVLPMRAQAPWLRSVMNPHRACLLPVVLLLADAVAAVALSGVVEQWGQRGVGLGKEGPPRLCSIAGTVRRL